MSRAAVTGDPSIALVIEDDVTLSTVIAYSLGRTGYEVMQAEDGYAGIAAARDVR